MTEHQTQAHLTPPLPSYKKIRGWLLLPALGVAISPVVLGINMLNDLANIAGFSFSQPKELSVAIYVMLYYIILMPLATTTFYNFFWKRKTAPMFYIAMSAANVLFSLINFLLYTLFPGLMVNQELSFMVNLTQVLGPILGAAIWIPYFIFSDRVKRTFVN
jgi:hypothetical protein